MKKTFRIPKSFNLMGRKITVKFSDNLMNDYSAIGLAKYNESLILIQSNTKASPMSKDAQKTIFFHEAMHFVYYLANDDKANDEKFVDVTGNLLLQMLESAEY